ncbi:hypothetical protein [Nonomuraea angiospora]|uniref:hypothetical protein n=1 Tax=Nonomuraea angiospora TaxID=46172 RepID=UPI0029BEFE96|nr:hypothetical protein [Nonomuraea angiospora]MDX3100496.1 hypothetical protein [Nonomuraea angiospora]
MKTIKQARRFYRVTYLDSIWTLPADPVGTARTVSMLRAARGWNLPIDVTPFTVDEIAPACEWCCARPRALVWTGTVRRESPWCDSPQCQAARRHRVAHPNHRPAATGGGALLAVGLAAQRGPGPAIGCAL